MDKASGIQKGVADLAGLLTAIICTILKCKSTHMYFML